MWLGHSLVTEHLDRADPVLVRLNRVLHRQNAED